MFSCTTWESDIPSADVYGVNSSNNGHTQQQQQQQQQSREVMNNSNCNNATNSLTDDEMITKVLTEGLKLKKKNKLLLNQINELTVQHEKEREKLISDFQEKAVEMENNMKKIKDSCVLEINQIQDQKMKEINAFSLELNEFKNKYNQLTQKNKSIQYEKEQIINQFHQEMNHLRIEYENEKNAFLELQKFKNTHYSVVNKNNTLQENVSNSMRRDDMSNNDEQRSILIRRAMLAEAEVEKLNDQLIKMNEKVSQLQLDANNNNDNNNTANNSSNVSNNVGTSPQTNNSSDISTPTTGLDGNNTEMQQEYERLKASLKDELDQRMILENEVHELKYELSYLKSSVLVALTAERDHLLEKSRQIDDSNSKSHPMNSSNNDNHKNNSSNTHEQENEIQKLQSANQQKYELLLRAKNEIINLKNQIDVFVASKNEVAEGVRIVTKQNEMLQEKIRLMTLEIKQYQSLSIASV